MNRVTEILQRAGLINGSGFFDEASRDRGSAVHLALEYDDQNDLDEASIAPEYVGYVQAYRRFKVETGFIPELIEHEVKYPRENYIGHLDRYGMLRDWPAVVDIKTNKQGVVSDWVRYQLVAYAFALNPDRYLHRVAVALRPDGKYKCRVFSIDEYNQDLAKFLEAARSCNEV